MMIITHIKLKQTSLLNEWRTPLPNLKKDFKIKKLRFVQIFKIFLMFLFMALLNLQIYFSFLKKMYEKCSLIFLAWQIFFFEYLKFCCLSLNIFIFCLKDYSELHLSLCDDKSNITEKNFLWAIRPQKNEYLSKSSTMSNDC